MKIARHPILFRTLAIAAAILALWPSYRFMTRRIIEVEQSELAYSDFHQVKFALLAVAGLAIAYCLFRLADYNSQKQRKT